MFRAIIGLVLSGTALLGATMLVGKPDEVGQQAASPSKEAARTILFIGNSYTFGLGSKVMNYGDDSVTDLNDERKGGVPALFKRFTDQAGLNYQVSLETAGGRTLKWHFETMRAKIDKPWDHVVLQEYSVLDPDNPGNPSVTVDYVGRLTSMFAERNPGVKVTLAATWSRWDMVFRDSSPWHDKPITAMAIDIRRGMDKAATAAGKNTNVSPVGEAFNCAIAAGIADSNPFDGIGPGQVNLWADDNYHGSTHGYYLEALTLFATVTGKDPRSLGAKEKAAADLGIAPSHAAGLQKVAWASAEGQTCSKAVLG